MAGPAPQRSRRTPRGVAQRPPRSPREVARLVGFLVLLTTIMIGLLVVTTIYLSRSLGSDALLADEPSRQERQVSRVDQPLDEVPTSGVVDYVALGDSFSAGPGIPTRRTDPVACDRSTNNFPAYLADWLGVASYTDVSCTGARTAHLEESQQRPDGTEVPAQADALTPGTDLVTITLGGNDFSLVQQLIDTCYGLAASSPEGTPCTDAFSNGTSNLLLDSASAVQDNLVAAIRTVRSRSPRAAVVVVGYPHLFPSSGTCTELGFAAGDSPFAASVVEAVATSVRRAAAEEGVRYVDLLDVTTGHDICADDPWFAGATPPPGGPAPWHATQEGMRQVARTVYAQLLEVEAPEEGVDAAPPAESIVINAS
ncbi:SGNH/GDSL hydrolase family protein [Nocardioides psychrotolerans]|uniref:SGNH/GDSL hydrolase family protein n=1 Tax=Nocardioides psychrotolerans TaxID=1005945 RepID=UPI0031380806